MRGSSHVDLWGIGFPKVPLLTFSIPNNFSQRCWLQYSELVNTTDLGKKILGYLGADSRCKLLEGRLLSSGATFEMYDQSRLAQWFLWRANIVGEAQARDDLESYLNNDSVEVLCTLWVLGLDTSEVVDIGNNVVLSPGAAMPDSVDKEHFLMHEMGAHATRIKPSAALVKKCRVEKVLSVSSNGSIAPPGDDFTLAMTQLYQLAVLINSLPGVCCVPYFSTSYVAESTPFGPFSGYGGGKPFYDVATSVRTKFPVAYAAELNELLEKYSRLSKNEQDRLDRILMRISQAKRRFHPEDKILDLGIAMEMLLLDDNLKDQLALSFRLRGSWILASSKEERGEKYDVLNKMYALRSSVAHTGTIHGGAPDKVQDATEQMPSFQALAEEAARYIIRNGRPDWKSVILNLVD